jgi:flagellin-like hook-associated protein FlgL
LVAVANTRAGDTYLFAGTDVQNAPYSVKSPAQQLPSHFVEYTGASSRTQVTIGSQVVDVHYPGREIFGARQRGETVVLGATGAAAGSGTNNAIGQGVLTVRHTSTVYEAGSGIAAGTSSVDGDTIIGPPGSHNLTFDGSGTISLNGGPAVSFDGTETDLKITGDQGDVVFVDTTAVTPGFTGTVAITSNGTLSMDGGATEVAIDFSSNQLLTNSATGEVTNVDSSNVRLTGTDQLEYIGTADAIQTLLELRDELFNRRDLAPGDWNDAMARRINDLDRVSDNIMTFVAEQSSTLDNLNAIQHRAEDLQLETKKLIGEIESADLTEVAINLQSEQNLLQFTLATTVRMFDQNILNFLG